MITIEQCRAARGLLGWTQQDLAEASGLSKTAINNFEKNHSDIKVESLRAIRMAFESADIEFMEYEGLRRKSDKAHIVSGPMAFSEIIEDIRHQLTQGVQEVLIQHFDPQILKHIGQEEIDHYMSVLTHSGASQKLLCARGTIPAISTPAMTRWMYGDQLQTGMTGFIYGDKLVLRVWRQNLFIVTHSRMAASAEKMRFEMLWEKAEIPQKSGVVHAQKG